MADPTSARAPGAPCRDSFEIIEMAEMAGQQPQEAGHQNFETAGARLRGAESCKHKLSMMPYRCKHMSNGWRLCIAVVVIAALGYLFLVPVSKGDEAA